MLPRRTFLRALVALPTLGVLPMPSLRPEIVASSAVSLSAINKILYAQIAPSIHAMFEKPSIFMQHLRRRA